MEILVILYVALVVFFIAAGWRIYSKAGKPGWASLVPIYNIVVMLEIVGKPTWWILLLFIPFVNFVIAIIIQLALAERFGKSAGFGVGLILLPIVFVPILAFSDAKYMAAGATATAGQQPPPLP